MLQVKCEIQYRGETMTVGGPAIFVLERYAVTVRPVFFSLLSKYYLAFEMEALSLKWM